MAEPLLPPGMPGPPPDAEQVSQMRERIGNFRRAEARAEAEARRAFLAWGAIFCTCNPRFSPERPSHADCQVHGQMMITWEGEVL